MIIERGEGVFVVADKSITAPFGAVGRPGKHFTERAQNNGLIVRGIGDSIALCPPLIISAAQVYLLLERFQRMLNETLNWVLANGD